MRVVALVVVACGCGVGTLSAPDAATVRGDGLPQRVITDAALWSDLEMSAVEGGASREVGGGDRPARGAADTGAATPDPTDVDGASACALLGMTCVGDEGCYPFPFEGTPGGGARCAFQGVGETSVPCQSQLECAVTSLCAAPGEPDSVCLRRCDPGNARCPTGMRCESYYSYVGVGVCR